MSSSRLAISTPIWGILRSPDIPEESSKMLNRVFICLMVASVVVGGLAFSMVGAAIDALFDRDSFAPATWAPFLQGVLAVLMVLAFFSGFIVAFRSFDKLFRYNARVKDGLDRYTLDTKDLWPSSIRARLLNDKYGKLWFHVRFRESREQFDKFNALFDDAVRQLIEVKPEIDTATDTKLREHDKASLADEYINVTEGERSFNDFVNMYPTGSVRRRIRRIERSAS